MYSRFNDLQLQIYNHKKEVLQGNFSYNKKNVMIMTMMQVGAERCPEGHCQNSKNRLQRLILNNENNDKNNIGYGSNDNNNISYRNSSDNKNKRKNKLITENFSEALLKASLFNNYFITIFISSRYHIVKIY